MQRILASGAVVGLALALGCGAVPAVASLESVGSEEQTTGSAAEPTDATVSVAGTSDPEPSETGLSEAGLNEAVLRDLGLTPEEFVAAGQLGRQAADVSEALRNVPGYLGTRLQDDKIIVAGSGPELEAEVTKLQVIFPALTVETPSAAHPGAPPASPTAVEETGAQPGAAIPVAAGTELAHSTEKLYQEYLREVGAAGLQAVAYNGSTFVIRTGGVNAPEFSVPDGGQQGGGAQQTTDSGTSAARGAGTGDRKLSAAEFVSRFANVKLDAGTELVPEEDLLGGQGYVADSWEICSTGFAAFDPAGLPALLTAGHCADDGAARQAFLENPPLTPGGLLGSFAFSQFGGADNSRVLRPDNEKNPGNVGTDIAVIGALRPDVDPLPVASMWGAEPASGPDRKITGMADPVVGMSVCRSGRTTAWSCGHVHEVGIYVAGGPDFATDPEDLRAFTGFLSLDVQSSGGDSGGPWVSGSFAVGTHSGGEGAGEPVNFAVAATLRESLKVLPGYQLEVFLNKPTVTSPAPGETFDAGQTITGQVAAAPASAVAEGSSVRITVDGQEPFEVPVDAAGTWSFTAPPAAGPLRFTAETVNGYSTSGAAAFSFEPTPVAPAVREPQPQATPTHADVPAPSLQSPAPAAVPAAHGAVSPAGDTAVVVRVPAANLANTGASGLLLAAGAAAGALAVGGLLLALARRRNRHR